MPKRILSFFIVLSLLAVFCIKTITVHAVSYLELAEHWAPQIYQDVNTSFDVRADYISNFNYDGDYNPLNNWQNLSYYQEKGYVYYKVSETTTHYFIEYDLFHARDDAYTASICISNTWTDNYVYKCIYKLQPSISIGFRNCWWKLIINLNRLTL